MQKYNIILFYQKKIKKKFLLIILFFQKNVLSLQPVFWNGF